MSPFLFNKENMDNLNIKLGTNLTRVLKVTHIYSERIKVKDTESEKVKLITLDETINKEFEISNVWVQTKAGKRSQGLWLTVVNNQISPYSGLGKLLKHYKCTTINDLKDKNVLAYPDEDNFLIILAFDMEQ